MNRTKALLVHQASALILAGAGFCFMTDLPASAQEVQHLSITQPGGMPGTPLMTGIERVTNGVSVTWYGPSGYYQLVQKPALTDTKWQPVGGLNLTNKAIITTTRSNAFFRVLGPSPQYAGVEACTECHAEVHDTEKNTPHAGAFTNLLFVAQGGQTNNSCLACHTVGAGLQTGFVSKNDANTNPRLAGVQCENCHGPAANHAANPDDPTTKPRVELAATVCGGCHNSKFVPAQAAASHPPYYEEWNASPHQAVLDELKTDFLSTNGPTVFIPTCGRCHSGTVREALLENTPLPDGHEAGAIGIACATCHDPHEVFIHTNALNGVFALTNALTGIDVVITNNELGVRYTNQLRNPLASLQDYHAAGDFTTNDNAAINVCGQCHNDRRASSASTDRPPHHSLQYNMLLGTVGELATGLPPNKPATHALIEKQCVGCHMQTSEHEAGPPEVPAVAGHKFAVTSYEACAACHGSAANAQGLVFLANAGITALSQQVIAGLDQWATNNAPAEIRKYGKLAWEYQNAGQISSPDGTLSGPVSNSNDPAKDEQKYIPANIKKARFNLYLVTNDGSQGVHNGPFAGDLLAAAQNWIQQELNK